jgi:hypothetical protein
LNAPAKPPSPRFKSTTNLHITAEIEHDAGGKSDPYFEVRKAHGVVWLKEGRTYKEFPYESPKAGEYAGTINSRSGQGDISLVARSNIIRNCLDPDWLTVKIPLSRYSVALSAHLLYIYIYNIK